jgi:SAM-dependent methyltransferase
MNDWPEWKKKRVFLIIRDLGLPATGRALDYGCGAGVFTRLLKEALPAGDVSGTDISDVGLGIARTLSNDVTYLDAADVAERSFDFIFSHHVMEHVDNIEAVANDFTRYAKPNAVMLHIMPCGNKGSLDHYIASHTINGIDHQKGNTFFYEEELHLNRFTTAQLSEIFGRNNWHLDHSFYANHQLGCLAELSGMNTQHIRRLTDGNNAIDAKAKRKFSLIRVFSLMLYYLQRPYTYFKLRNKSKAWTGPLLRHPELGNYRTSLTEVLLFPSYAFVLLRSLMEKMDWNNSKRKHSGSEMYLVFHKK